MNKSTLLGCFDKIIEWSFYGIVAVAPFSITLVETFAVFMIIAWCLKKIITKDLAFLQNTEVRLLIIFFIWVVLSCFNSQYFSESFRGVFSKIGKCVLLFIIVATGMEMDPKKGKRFLTVLLISSVIICVNGVIQYFIGYDLIRHRTLISKDYMNRISSTFIHPNNFGVYLLMILAIFISYLISLRKNLLLSFVMAGAALMAGICLFLTNSRGAWISFAASLIILGVLKSKKILAAFMVFLIIIFMILPVSTKERIISLADFKNGTSWERVMLWRGTIDMIKTHPILGFGINTFSRNFPAYKPKEYPDLRYTHNCYLQLASEIGIPGLVFFLSFLMFTLIVSLKKIVILPSGVSRYLLTGLFAGLAGYYLNCMVDTHLFSVNLSSFSYILLGFLSSMSQYAYKVAKE